MATVRQGDRFICSTPQCRGEITKKLCDDLPGQHSYIWACTMCHREYGEEWGEDHHSTMPPLQNGLPPTGPQGEEAKRSI